MTATEFEQYWKFAQKSGQLHPAHANTAISVSIVPVYYIVNAGNTEHIVQP